MSMDPDTMQQMLMQRLQQAPQSVGGMQPQTNPGQAGAQLMQKIMLMKALQNPTPMQRQATNAIPQVSASMNAQMPQVNQQLAEGVNQTMAANPQIQAAQQPLTPQQLQAINPALMPPPGVS